MNNGLPAEPSGEIDIQYLAIDPLTPSTLYANIYGYGVFKSTDAGSSWTAGNNGLPTYTSDGKTYIIDSLATDPLTPSTLYAGIRDHVVFKSMDGGGTWTASNTGLRGDEVAALAIDHLTPSTLYAGITSSINQSHFGVYKSTDEGSSWTISSGDLAGIRVSALVSDPLTPSTLYAGTGIGVYKSTDGGNRWTASITGLSLSVRALAIDPLTPSTLYAGANGVTIYKSTDAGSSWTAFNNGLPTSARYREAAQIFTLAIDPNIPSNLYAGTHLGVYKSTDGGNNWTAISKGLPTDISNSITYTSPIFIIAIDPLTPSTLYAGTSTGGVFKSTDGGNSWTTSSSGLQGSTVRVNALAIDPLTPSTLYAGTSGAGVYKSTDRGASWAAMNNGLGDLFVDTLAVDPLTPSTLYAGTSNGVYIFAGDTINGGGGSGGGGSGNHSGSSGSECFITTVSP
jgi:photosystem II stability/assembly factor-like uncharacterized protein